MVPKISGDKAAGIKEKLSRASSCLEGLCEKFPSFVDTSVLKELDRIASILEADFVTHRPPEKVLIDEMPVIPIVRFGSHALKKKNLVMPQS